MLNSYSDLVEGQVYLFRDEEVVYSLKASTARYEAHPTMDNTHVFTAWPSRPSSRSVYFSSEQVNMLIAMGDLVAV